MKFCYANRRMTLYPNSVDPWDLAPEDYTDQFLKKVKDMGCLLYTSPRPRD